MFKTFINKFKSVTKDTKKEPLNEIHNQLNEEENNVKKVEKNQNKEYKLEVEKLIMEELQDNIMALETFFMSICPRYTIIKDGLEDLSCSVSEDAMYLIFKEIYVLTKDITNLTEFDEKFSVQDISKMIVKYFDVFLTQEEKEYLNSTIETWVDYKIDSKALVGSIVDFDWIDMPMESLLEAQNGDRIDVIRGKNVALLYMFNCVKALNRAFILLRNKERLHNNEEFYTIQKNLVNEIKDYSIIWDKLDPIYQKFYAETFGDVMDSCSLLSLIYMINNLESNEEKITKNEFTEIEIEKIEELIEQIKLEESRMNFKAIFDKLKIFVRDVQWSKFYDKNHLIMFTNCIIRELMSDISLKTVIEYYKGIYIVIEIYEEHQSEQQLLMEKERFLQGDFSVENAIEVDKLELENINTGEEFEHYLRNLFEKLGYTAEITQCTGDQGADLIIYKDGIKTVVQAKYYSNSVGNKAVQEVNSAIKYYEANKGMVVTNSYYTKSAKELAEANNIELIDGEGLLEIRQQIIQFVTSE